jgi:hypothetical protein
LQSNKKNIYYFYTTLLELDASIKLWKVPDTYFWLGIKKIIATIQYI